MSDPYLTRQGESIYSHEVKKSQNLTSLMLLVLVALGLAFFLTLYLQIPSLNIEDHGYSFSFLPFFLTLGAAFLFLFILWKGLALFDGRFCHLERQKALYENIFPFLPLSIFLLTPLCLKHFLLREDLRTRLNLLLIFAIFSFSLVKLLQLKSRLDFRNYWKKGMAGFIKLPRRKKLILLFLISFLIYQLCTLVIVSKGLAFSGDEPWYLMTTHSLYQEQDINVANNYSNQDYFHFYPRELYPKMTLGIYGRFGKKGTDWIYPINQPGISVLMLPFYALSQLFKGRVLIFIIKGGLAIWTSLLGIQLFLLANNLWKRERLSLILWFLYSFSAPILFYAFHLYPEVPIALIFLYLFRKIRSPGQYSTLQYLFFGFVLSLSIWFGLKYNLIFWPFLLISGYLLLKEHRAKWKILVFFTFPALSLILFYMYVHALYGTYNPIAVYEGVLTPDKIQAFKQTIFKEIPHILRINTLFDYFLDQRDGLLLYSPIYFFSLLGLVEVFRRAKRDLVIFLLLSLPFILNYAFLSHRQGYSPQGRVLTSISWILIILIGYFLVYNKKKIFSTFFWIASFLGLTIMVLLISNPSFLYQPTTHDVTFRGGEFFVSLSNLSFYLPSFLPSFIKINNLGYWPNYVWIVLILVFLFSYIRKKKPRAALKYPHQTTVVTAVLLIFFCWFSLFPKETLLNPVNVGYDTGEKITFYSLNRHQQLRGPGKFLLSKDIHEYIFYFTSWRQLKDIRIDFGSLDGDHSATLKIFDHTLFDGETSQEMKTVEIPSPPAYRYKKTNLYRISLNLKNQSDFPAAEKSYMFIIQVSD